MARLARRSLRIKDLPLFSLQQSFRDLADTADCWVVVAGWEQVEKERCGKQPCRCLKILSGELTAAMATTSQQSNLSNPQMLSWYHGAPWVHDQ